MSLLSGLYPITYGGCRVGILNVTQDALMTALTCRAEIDTSAILRLWCPNGFGYTAIGVLIPSDGAVCLERRFSKNALASLGITGFEGCVISEQEPHMLPAVDDTEPDVRAPDSPEKWRPMGQQCDIFHSQELNDICSGISNALISTDGDDILLAVPLSSDVPFPAMPVFCFGDSITIGDAWYVVFRSRSGYLI